MNNQQQLSELALWAILIGIATGSALLTWLGYRVVTGAW